MIKSTPEKQTRQELHPHHLFVGGKDAGTETIFLYFKKCYETGISYKPKREIKIQQGHSDVTTSTFAVAVTSTPQKQSAGQSCYDRSLSIFLEQVHVSLNYGELCAQLGSYLLQKCRDKVGSRLLDIYRFHPRHI